MNLSTSWIALLFLAISLLPGCGPRNEFKPPPPPAVDIVDALEMKVADEITFTGTTRARATVDLRAKVTGYLKEIKFKDGDTVEKDQVLFVIERDPFLQELEARKADLQKAQASLKLADANLKRTDRLRQENASTQQQIDIVNAERATAEASVNAENVAVSQAELNLSYTEIHAPMTGRIGRHLVDKGNLVQSGAMSLGIIEEIAPIDVYFYVSETDLLQLMSKIREGELPDPKMKPPKLKMGLLTDKNYPYEGFLNFRELGVDPGTGTILRRAEFKNEDQSLVPGLFVRLRSELGEPRNRVLIEDVAVSSDQRGDYVYVVVKETKKDSDEEHYVAKQRAVTLGIAQGDLRVVEKGISAGDWVIVSGVQKARPDSPVAVDWKSVASATETRAQRHGTTPPTIPDPLPEPKPVAPLPQPGEKPKVAEASK